MLKKAHVMLSTTDIHSLADFQSNTKNYIQRLAGTKRPEVQTVNGKPQVAFKMPMKSKRQSNDALHTVKYFT